MSAVLERVARPDEIKSASRPVRICPNVPLFEGWAIAAMAAMALYRRDLREAQGKDGSPS